ncbi:hypothetical protein NIES4071_36290 [Calothrix sp. NIES-4071]|nr:hypothetical protein NIES4071_36290 [Calothrix sp. NIES-4071]BAZ57948.1 hypothetical protein NIES4105_36220 [Calothrix sp. NIES-4105]
MQTTESTLFDKFFRDSNGNIVIAQPPNLPIILWAVTSLLQLVITSGKINIGLDVVSYGAIFTWAWLELFQGVNYFRRSLGLIVLVGVIASRIYSFNLI